MKQVALDLKLSVKKTRKREFLEQMERVVPWTELVALIANIRTRKAVKETLHNSLVCVNGVSPA